MSMEFGGRGGTEVTSAGKVGKVAIVWMMVAALPFLYCVIKH